LTVDGVGDPPQFVHHCLEPVQGETLLAVAECRLRVVVNFDDDPICSCCDCRSGQVRHQGPLTCRVAGVNDDREVGLGFQHRYGTDIKGVASRSLERPDSSFAEDYPGISGSYDVFGCKQQFFDG